MRRIAPLIALVALALPQAAHASRSQESMFQDDRSLLYAGDARRENTLDQLQSLGVDTIRVNVLWSKVAPNPRSKHRPAFDATNSGAYPSSANPYPFAALDAVVAGAQRRGMNVQLTPTVPGPAWASSCKGSSSRRQICRPKPAEYGRFVTALGRRYPSVRRWSIMNEPNQGSWLTPQYVKRHGHWVPESPRVYRNLVRAATGALAATGHGGDQILFGETAPIGRTSGRRYSRSIGPVDFYRELFCLNSRGHKLRGRAARIRGCRHYAKLGVTGVAHHPYTRGAGQSPNARVGRSDITLAKIGRLSLWLDRAARQGRIPSGLGIWLTEYGFQTRPPDRYAGTSLRNQARWINESDWIAWRNGRIRSVDQYELRDDPSLGAFQTGLRFKNGKPKPSLAAYRLPIWPRATHHGTRLWLQVRPESRLGTPQQVTIQYKGRHKHRWRTLKTATVTDPHGFLHTSTHVRASYWRFRWGHYRSRTAPIA